ncbi:hypothetical protein [Phaffia rhodozyma]|uniref:Anti-proliferative protein domain-containing protein n=1 Tax=Phaffia rhodozyma TaxID=264483 RepID=A0A0F7SWR7_PHARH|nr:hypothetical protein [Phaffia rhodozyma]
MSMSNTPSSDSLLPALAVLINTLTKPVEPLVTLDVQLKLRKALLVAFIMEYAPSWHPAEPTRGSAARSLIAYSGKLPAALRFAAAEAVLDPILWETALRDGLAGGKDEWQIWCDPGRISIREGGWEWEDGVFYHGGWKDTIRTIWSCPLLPTPPSQAIPIRPPSFVADALAPLPSLSTRPDSPSAESDTSFSTFTSTSTLSEGSSSHPTIYAHHGTTERKVSDASSVGGLGVSAHQLSRSVSPMSAGGKLSVTAYDGGKVGVLGGGVKLGGGSGSGAGQAKPQANSQTGNGKRARGPGKALVQQQQQQIGAYNQVNFQTLPAYNPSSAQQFSYQYHHQRRIPTQSFQSVPGQVNSYNAYATYRG